MTYRVFWSPHAEQRLEAIVLNADDTSRLAAAAREIDRQLVDDPNTFGESRYDAIRVGFIRPLGIQFEILEDVLTVIVFDVWRIKKRKR